MHDRALSVMQVLPALESGGVERGTVEIAAALVDSGHRAVVISAGGALVKEIESCGATHITLPVGEKSLSSVWLISKLRHILHNEKITHLHPRSRLPAWLSWLALRGIASARQPRFITTVHGFYSVNAYSAIMTRGERVICVSNAIKRYVLQCYPKVDPARLTVIPRGIDHHQFTRNFVPTADWLQQWQRQQPECSGRTLLLLPGRLTRLKGHHDFIHLIHDLLATGRNVHGLVLGGKDPRKRAYAEGLRQLVHRDKLDTRISFLGKRTDVREIMSISSLVLSLSTKPESFGRTTLEALSLGRPVLGYAHGGVEEVLAQLYPAGLSAVGDRQALLHNAQSLLDQPPSVDIKNFFDLKTMKTKTLDAYQQLNRCA